MGGCWCCALDSQMYFDWPHGRGSGNPFNVIFIIIILNNRIDQAVAKGNTCMWVSVQ